MIEPRQLRHVLALANHRHFGRAAAALGLSQPALSRSIQAAEARLGVRLFDRSGHGVRPTRLGAFVAERAEALVRDFEALGREVDARRDEVAGSVRVGAGQFPAELSVARALGRLVATRPRLQAELRVTDWRQVVDDVRSGRVDLAVAETSEAARDDALATEDLAEHRLVLFAAADHPMCRGRPRLEDLLAFPWAGTKAPPRMAAFFPDDLGAGFTRDARTGDLVPAVFVVGTDSAKRVVAESRAIGAATLVQLRDDLEAGRVAVVPFQAPWLRLRYGCVVPRGRWLPPAAERLVEHVRAAEAELCTQQEELWATWGPR